MGVPSLTVLMATYNGENVLPRTLSGYRRLIPPSVEWKLVVVDNASSDGTRRILEASRNDIPIEILYEPIPGKTRALNRGIGVVTGELVIITDDDAIPDPGFLQAWAKFLDTELDFGMFGGTIIPIYDVPPPVWVLQEPSLFPVMFAARDEREGPIAADCIFGPNMAIRKSVFDRGARFAENLGPNASDPNYPMSDETEFCCRMAQSGVASWFAKEPTVRHIVRAYQFTDAYCAKRAYSHGRGIALQLEINGERRSFVRHRLSVIKQQIKLLQVGIEMLLPGSTRRWKNLYEYHRARGFNDEHNRTKSKIDSRARL